MAKQLNRRTIAAALVITTVVFLAGVWMGTVLSREKARVLETELEEVSSEVESFQLQFLMLDILGEEATCDLLKSRLREVNAQSYELLQKISSYEDGTLSGGSTELKKRYYRSLIKYWTFNKRVGDVCGQSTDSILYFFTDPCPACENQGVVLTYYKNNLGEDLLVFPLQADFGDPFIDTLTNHYNVTEYPTIILNEEKMEGFISREDMREELCEDSPQLSVCGELNETAQENISENRTP